MQVPYQTQSSVTTLSETQTTMPVSGEMRVRSALHHRYPREVNRTSKSDDETYGNKLIYSPYLAPSHLMVEQRSRSGAFQPTYMHNVARTKYEMISRAEKPNEHYRLNLFV